VCLPLPLSLFSLTSSKTQADVVDDSLNARLRSQTKAQQYEQANAQGGGGARRENWY
jgi:hypothetical protein